ncbi:hypothetical protein DFQ30_004560 [Apophysomyces sp. BC1015]|nr:hypothetical protein DFQ30_004560 [Apophysomyces sp. BC1015]
MSYTSTRGDSLDNASIHSAPPLPEDTVCLSKRDISTSLESYENLLSAAKVYREHMIQLAGAAAGFGYALEKVAHSKTASETGQGMQAAAGLQLLLSNHQQILSDMFYKALEQPLAEHLEHHKTTVKQSQENYESALKMMSKKIRETEAKNMKNGRKGKRDIRQFRQALQDLTQQVDEVDRIKSDYQQHMIDMERRHNHLILGKISTIVRAQVDIYERISNKGLADPVLEQMIAQNPDPFCAYSSTTDESTGIFTVLPPISLIDTQTPTTCIGQEFGDEDDYRMSPIPMMAENYKSGFSLEEEENQMKKPLYNLPRSHQTIWPGNNVRSVKEKTLGKEQTATTTMTATITTTATTEDEGGSSDEQWDRFSSDEQQKVKKETSVGSHRDDALERYSGT